MWYLTPDATGMTYIARCLETIKGILINMPDSQSISKLKVVAGQTHNLELFRVKELTERPKIIADNSEYLQLVGLLPKIIEPEAALAKRMTCRRRSAFA